MAEKITEDVFKISGNSNVYVILGEEPIVIDTSDGDNRGNVRKEIDRLVGRDNIKHVLLTHLHYDHVENLDLFSEADVYVSKEEYEDYMRDPLMFFLDGCSEKVKEMITNAKLLGEEVYGLKVISVPGHTRGGVAYLDEKRKILFSGDTLFENGIGRYDFPNSVPDKIMESVKKLRDLSCEKNLKLCSGHNY